MDFFDILLAKKLEDDRDPKVEGLSVTANGTYSEDGVVYKPVVVNVPETTLTTLNATENGTYTAPSGTAYNEVDVDVPLPENAYLKKSVSGLPQPIASFNDGSDNPLKSLTASIVPVQSGSGDPSPTNVRPISGWSGVDISDYATNMLDVERSESGGIDTNGNLVTGNALWRTTIYTPVKPNTTYTFSSLYAIQRRIYFYDIQKNFQGRLDGVTTFTTNSDTYFIKWTVYLSGAIFTKEIIETYELQIQLGSEATSYVPYNNNNSTTTIPFTDSQGNPVEVFGGSVDVTGGALADDGGKKVFDGSENWRTNGNAGVYIFVSDIPNLDVNKGLLFDKYKFLNEAGEAPPNNCANFNAQKTAIQIRDSRAMTNDAFKTLLQTENLTMAYKKTTPTTFYTQPTSIKSLDGENNVFASTGDVEELKYFTRATS